MIFRRRPKWPYPDDEPHWVLAGLVDNSGYVREEALRRIGPAGLTTVLPVAVLKLNDWVPEIRALATEVLAKWITPQYARAWTHALPSLLSLEHCQRREDEQLAAIREPVLALLRGAWNGGMLAEGTRSKYRAIRRACWQVLLDPANAPLTTIEDALEQDDPWVRRRATQRMRGGEGWEPFALHGTHSKYTADRRLFLREIIEARVEGWLERAQEMLLDPSIAVGRIAAAALRREGLDPLELVRRAALGNARLILLCDWVTEGTDPDLELARKSDSPRVRAAALEASARLKPTGWATHLHSALLRGGIERRTALECLQRSPEAIDRAFVDSLIDDGQAATGVSLARWLPFWERLPRLLRGFMDHEERAKELSERFVREWLWGMNRVFTKPSEKEHAMIRLALAEVEELMPSPLVAEVREAVQTKA